MANGIVVYTIALLTRRKGEVLRGGCGCDARVLISRRNDGVAAPRGWSRGAGCVAEVATVRKSGAAPRGSRRSGFFEWTAEWRPVPDVGQRGRPDRRAAGAVVMAHVPAGQAGPPPAGR